MVRFLRGRASTAGGGSVHHSGLASARCHAIDGVAACRRNHGASTGYAGGNIDGGHDGVSFMIPVKPRRLHEWSFRVKQRSVTIDVEGRLVFDEMRAVL